MRVCNIHCTIAGEQRLRKMLEMILEVSEIAWFICSAEEVVITSQDALNIFTCKMNILGSDILVDGFEYDQPHVTFQFCTRDFLAALIGNITAIQFIMCDRLLGKGEIHFNNESQTAIKTTGSMYACEQHSTFAFKTRQNVKIEDMSILNTLIMDLVIGESSVIVTTHGNEMKFVSHFDTGQVEVSLFSNVNTMLEDSNNTYVCKFFKPICGIINMYSKAIIYFKHGHELVIELRSVYLHSCFIWIQLQTSEIGINSKPPVRLLNKDLMLSPRLFKTKFCGS